MTSHTLYRFFDGRGCLLYVGRTTNPRQRWRSHEKTKDWFDDVATVTREVLDSAEAVDAAERRAIVEERPVHNIALNPLARTTPQVWRPSLSGVVFQDEDRSYEVRLNSLDLSTEERENLSACLEDEAMCECPACHRRRLHEFEDLESKYDWHPLISEQIDSVRKDYYSGAYLGEWYYDLSDIEMGARIQLTHLSSNIPIPAYGEPTDFGLLVDCPLCFQEHRHHFASGASIDAPMDAGCEPPMRGGRYVLAEDWSLLFDAQTAWAIRASEIAA